MIRGFEGLIKRGKAGVDMAGDAIERIGSTVAIRFDHEGLIFQTFVRAGDRIFIRMHIR